MDRDEAEKRIGHRPLPQSRSNGGDSPEHQEACKLYVGRKLTVTAWLWAGTVKSHPVPAFRPCGCAVGIHLYAFDKSGQGSLCAAGD